jgi:MFS superfamily sulfate permease-like transporter
MNKKGNAPLWLSLTSAISVWLVGVILLIIANITHNIFLVVPSALIVGAFTNIAIKIFILGLKFGFKKTPNDID